ncbi:MAG: hypothetical protein ACJ736_14735 [Streptomyces sp.]
MSLSGALVRPLRLGVHLAFALFTQALLDHLGRIPRPDQLLLTGAAPLGEFVHGRASRRRVWGRRASAGARLLGYWGAVRAEMRWRGESVDEAAAHPLIGCGRICEYGAQGRFQVLLDRVPEPLPGVTGELGGLRDSGETTWRLCAERTRGVETATDPAWVVAGPATAWCCGADSARTLWRAHERLFLRGRLAAVLVGEDDEPPMTPSA